MTSNKSPLSSLSVVAWVLVLALLAVFPLLPEPIGGKFHTELLAKVMIMAIFAASLQLLVGYTGQKSLGHAGLFAVGAYTVALLTARLGWNPWSAFAAAGVMAGLFGIVIALPSLRVKGPALAMVTIGFGIVVEKVVSEWQDVFAGQQGIYGVVPLSLVKMTMVFLSRPQAFSVSSRRPTLWSIWEIMPA